MWPAGRGRAWLASRAAACSAEARAGRAAGLAFHQGLTRSAEAPAAQPSCSPPLQPVIPGPAEAPKSGGDLLVLEHHLSVPAGQLEAPVKHALAPIAGGSSSSQWPSQRASEAHRRLRPPPRQHEPLAGLAPVVLFKVPRPELRGPAVPAQVLQQAAPAQRAPVSLLCIHSCSTLVLGIGELPARRSCTPMLSATAMQHRLPAGRPAAMHAPRGSAPHPPSSSRR